MVKIISKHEKETILFDLYYEWYLNVYQEYPTIAYVFNRCKITFIDWKLEFGYA